MFLNSREKPIELLYYIALSKRKELTNNEKYQLSNLEKGFEGESLYDEIFDFIGHDNLYIIRDLYLHINNSVTQYDSIIVMDNRIVVNEVKNLTGDYRYDNNSWYKNNRQMESDPFIQLNRAKNKIVSLGNKSSLDFYTDSKVIFPNDDFNFTSDNEKMHNQAVMRTQLKNYFRSFRNETIGDNAKNIVQLIKNSITSKPDTADFINISELKHGLYCGHGSSFNLLKGKFQFKCSDCGSIESYETHLVRAMFDYKYLFPSHPMTRLSLLQLIDYKINKNTVFCALKKHCCSVKKGNSTYYTLKYSNFNQQLSVIRSTQRYKDKIIHS